MIVSIPSNFISHASWPYACKDMKAEFRKTNISTVQLNILFFVSFLTAKRTRLNFRRVEWKQSFLGGKEKILKDYLAEKQAEVKNENYEEL